jgi:type IX secretion system substrate protein/galactose oxidase-like protein
MKKIITLTLSLSLSFSLLKADYWTQKANFPGDTLFDAFSFSIGNKGYAGTGAIGYFGVPFSREFWEYDLPANIWTQKADYGGGNRFAAIGFAIGNKGYAGLGSDSTGMNQQDFWEYDPSSNVWTQKANFSGGARVFAVGFSIGNMGYAGMGTGTTSAVSDLWQYNPATNTWLQKATLPGLYRRVATPFVIGNNAYIAGGWNLNNGVLSELWEYNSISDTWLQKANFPLKKSYAAAVSLCDKGYFGTGDSVPTNFFTNDWWQYDPATDVWTQKTNFPGQVRCGAAYFSIGSKGYIGLGGPGISSYNDFWEYTPDSVCATGIEELTIYNLQFTIAPNPVKEFIVISYPLTGKEKIKITITDINGRKVFDTQLQAKTLNFKLQTSNFSNGIYFVELNNEKEKAVKKFLKE